jgi:hypothetical protein
MKLSRNEIIVLFSAFGAVILSSVLYVLIKEWYSPDIRFEEGAYYFSKDNAITYLKIVNFGRSDAEDVKVKTLFRNKINDISLRSDILKLNYLSGGVGSKDVVIKIERIVPSYELVIYFSVDNFPENIYNENGFVSDIIFKGGKGKTGRPRLWFLLFAFLTNIIVGIAGYYFGRLSRKILENEQS